MSERVSVTFEFVPVDDAVRIYQARCRHQNLGDPTWFR